MCWDLELNYSVLGSEIETCLFGSEVEYSLLESEVEYVMLCFKREFSVVESTVSVCRGVCRLVECVGI